MNIVYFNAYGKLIDETNALKRTHHQNNLAYLNQNIDLKDSISEQLDKKIISFIRDIITEQEAHLHSAEIARELCAYLNLPHEKPYPGLVGSLLLEKLKQTNPSKYGLKNTIVIVASKGEGQKWFYYFPVEEEEINAINKSKLVFCEN